MRPRSPLAHIAAPPAHPPRPHQPARSLARPSRRVQRQFGVRIVDREQLKNLFKACTRTCLRGNQHASHSAIGYGYATSPIDPTGSQGRKARPQLHHVGAISHVAPPQREARASQGREEGGLGCGCCTCLLAFVTRTHSCMSGCAACDLTHTRLCCSWCS